MAPVPENHVTYDHQPTILVKFGCGCVHEFPEPATFGGDPAKRDCWECEAAKDPED